MTQRQQRYWLFKSEPEEYSYDDLARDGVAEWSGVRNFQARNFLRDDVKEGFAAIGTRCGATGRPDVSASPRTAVTPPGAFQFAKWVDGLARRSAATPTGRL